MDDRDAFRVALHTMAPVSDHAWNCEAHRGLLAERDSMGASIRHIQTRTPASFGENFREYGRQSCELVIGHGFAYKGVAERITPLFPGTDFLVISSEDSGPNVAGIRFGFAQPSQPSQPSQPADLAGIAAAVRFLINDSSVDYIDTEVRQSLDSAWKELESGAWRSPVSWTAQDR